MENLNQYNDYINTFKQNNCCIILSTYNNASQISEVICNINKFCNDIVVINDGSNDNTLDVLSKIKNIKLISYSKNKGKGYALKKGFEYALELGFEYAITMDADGQHYAESLIAFLEKIIDNPNAIIIGARKLKQYNKPGKSSFANKFSNFWFKIETGLEIPDTQSGFRVYPLRKIKELKLFTNRYEFELEVLVKAAWKGISITYLPIKVYYPPIELSTSHFRPFKDFFRISILNIYLVTLALSYYRPRQILKTDQKKPLKKLIKEDILLSNCPNHIIAFSIALGIFMGIFPIWGFQLIVGFIIAYLLKLNKTLFFIAANISIAPLIPIIIYLSYVTGSFFMGEFSWKVDFDLSLEATKYNFKQYIIGSVMLSIIASTVLGFLTYLLLLIFKKR